MAQFVELELAECGECVTVNAAHVMSLCCAGHATGSNKGRHTCVTFAGGKTIEVKGGYEDVAATLAGCCAESDGKAPPKPAQQGQSKR